MGWKASLVIINRTIEMTVPELIKKLGGSQVTYTLASTLEKAIYPEENKLYVGFYQGNTIICDADLPLIFYDEGLSEVEKNFIKIFPEAEIAALSLDSFDNFYGYALLEKGKKTRVKVGDCQVSLRLEVGKPLPEEREIYENSIFRDDKTRLFRIGDDIGTKYTEDAVGEEFVFEIAKRFLGDRLDSRELDKLFFEVPFQCYVK
ncbi:hypothetical protein LGH70_07745 [Hymenobacter sp. BT635]|uniref:DUF3846 domain-containing protein n=1 Tax=Hymenobacter nitidus TaxID=2880929 RepID=A0ABS8AEN7_9BACT|nr:hypothetical protein [Hymenobacter nitidus]MCB2377469.1 hypothetical protein [Hymenobacter nitidus]